MSYAQYESSTNSGLPVELYKFTYKAQQWMYTSADTDISYIEDTYVKRFIERSAFTQSGDSNKSNLEITVHASDPVTEIFRHGWLNDIMLLTVFRNHFGDSDFRVIWKGRIVNCTWNGSTAKLISDSVFSLFKRAGIRRRYEVGCPLVLYGEDCGVNKDSYEFVSTVSSVDGTKVTVNGASALGAGYFDGGIFKFGDSFRFITKQDGNDIYILDTIESLEENVTVSLWPGCARSLTVCTDKFNNSINYGGLPYLPYKNIFNGNSIV